MADATRRRVIPWWRQRPWQIGIGAGVVVVVAVVLVLVLGGGDDDGTSATTGAATSSTVAPPVAPLTGLPDPTGEVLRRSALTAKIANNPEARPQQGLEDADVVYEEEVEGRITRFLAVFHSRAPEAFGPIRSVRAVDPDIVWPLRGLFAYSGGVPRNVAAIRAAPVQSFDETQAGDAMFLDRSFSTGERPNILFGRPEVFWARADDRTPPQPLFRYLADGEAFGGEPVAAVTIPVGATSSGESFWPTWRWDAEREVWLREMNGEPHLARSGDQISTDTLFVQFVPGGGAETQVIGEGEAAVLADGMLVRGRWRRPSREAPATFVDAAGAEILVPPGRAWVALPFEGGELLLEPGTAATTSSNP